MTGIARILDPHPRGRFGEFEKSSPPLVIAGISIFDICPIPDTVMNWLTALLCCVLIK